MKLLSTILALALGSAVAGNVKYSLQDDEVDASVCSGSSAAKSLSGYFQVSGSEYDTKNDKNYFFWMHEAQNDPANAPFVVWLTGGPGCSSTLALLTENGPCSVNADGTGTEANTHSWNTNANVLWLDQPAGVGFSYGQTNDENEVMVGEDAYYFMQHFMAAHPEYAKSDLFIFGESYGGHYAPAMAHRIFEGNKNLKDGDMKLNLAGVGVGNGLTQPEIQYEYYAEMAYNNSHGIECVDEKTYEKMVDATQPCIDKIKKCNDKGGFYCTTAYTYCNTQLTTPYYSTGLNPYDIRKECGDNPLCYDFSNVEKWLTTDSTREALHVTSDSAAWVSCNNNVNAEFRNDWMINYDGLVADMLEGGVKVLIYAGDVDFICNSLGNKAWTLDVEWSGKEGFNAAADKDWESGSGSVRSYNGLTFLTVFDAGHMVPSDQPEAALTMLDTFITGGDLILGKPDPVHPIKCTADLALIAEDMKNGKDSIDEITADCDKNLSADCLTELTGFMGVVDVALGHATSMLSDCTDGSNSECNEDLNMIVDTLEGASSEITKALSDCPAKSIKDCVTDVVDAGKSVFEVVEDGVAAYKACEGE
ncbi:hypothetical protein TrLO_g13849 [Triparma laevis f. longispina]|uniref:Carboxypeptidase n=1 Tax=Triparma laevis f. longispina TaxID=1714387 RepID=A0A9W7AUI3_9STRA|nr:hypothetical protein TrLO_g13849 [Triparma laevis f. longispina]